MSAEDRLITVDDYLRGRMSDEDAATFEEAMFDDPGSDTAEAARFVDELGRMAAYLVERTTFHIGHTRAEVDEIMRKHTCAVIDAGSGGTVHAKVTRKAEIYISRLKVDLRGVERIDLETHVEGYGLVKTIRDARFDPADGEVFAVCEAPLAHLTYARPVAVLGKLIGIVGGERRVLAESAITVELVD